MDQEQEDEPDVKEIERETLSLGSSFSLYDEEDGDRDKGAKGRPAEKEKEPGLAPEPPQEKRIENKITLEVQHIITLLNMAVDARIENVAQEVQSITTVLNNVSEKVDGLTEKVGLVQTQGMLTYQTVSMAAVRDMQEAAAATAKRPRVEPPPEANKRPKVGNKECVNMFFFECSNTCAIYVNNFEIYYQCGGAGGVLYF